MTDAHFDTMAAVQMLREAGVAPQQAEAMVSAISESQHNLATKDDVALLEANVKTAIANSLNAMTIRVGMMLAFSVTLLTALELLR